MILSAQYDFPPEQFLPLDDILEGIAGRESVSAGTWISGSLWCRDMQWEFDSLEEASIIANRMKAIEGVKVSLDA